MLFIPVCTVVMSVFSLSETLNYSSRYCLWGISYQTNGICFHKLKHIKLDVLVTGGLIARLLMP